MSKVRFSGSCLCGAVKYKANGEVLRFSHCHCQRCRKATGTGHASNILISPVASVEWQQGESLLTRYDVPDAERFYNYFCKKCGSPMPRVVKSLDAVLIPAGSIDDDLPDIQQQRIFWDSRAEWSCEAGDLPVFSEYPK